MGLKQWLEERWVDISRPKPGGGYHPCGARGDGKSRDAYPKCVPAARASRMSKKEKKSAVRRKREAVGKARSMKTPTYVSTLVKLKRAKGR